LHPITVIDIPKAVVGVKVGRDVEETSVSCPAVKVCVPPL
jgi:hypothetical protein